MYRELNHARSSAVSDQRLRHRLPRSRARSRPCARSSAGSPERRRHERDGDDRRPGPGRRSAPSPSAGSKPSSTLPYADGGIAWDPSLVFPGLRRGRAARKPDRAGAAGADPRRRRHAAGRGPGRRTRTPARQRRDRRHRRSRRSRRRRRCAKLAAPGLPAGHPGRRQRPRAGLQRPPRRQARRLAARRRRQRAARPAILAEAEPEAGRAGEDDDRPRPAGSGGLRARRPRPAASPCSTPATATSAPSPARPSPPRSRPGSTFKMITTDGRPAEGRRLARRRIRNHQRRQRRRPLHRQRQRRVLRRHLPPKPSPSPATPTSPRSGPKIGNDDLVATAERFGFNSPPTLYAPKIVARSRTARIDASRPRSATELDLGVTRDRPGRSAGDAAADGERRADDRQRRRARADLDRRQPEAAPRRRSRCG